MLKIYLRKVSRHSKVPRLAHIGIFLSAGPCCGEWGPISREEATLTGEHINQDLIRLVKILYYIGFMYMMGPDYYGPSYYYVSTAVLYVSSLNGLTDMNVVVPRARTSLPDCS